MLNIKEDVLAQKIKIKTGIFVFLVDLQNNHSTYNITIYMRDTCNNSLSNHIIYVFYHKKQKIMLRINGSTANRPLRGAVYP